MRIPQTSPHTPRFTADQKPRHRPTDHTAQSRWEVEVEVEVEYSARPTRIRDETTRIFTARVELVSLRGSLLTLLAFWSISERLAAKTCKNTTLSVWNRLFRARKRPKELWGGQFDHGGDDARGRCTRTMQYRPQNQRKSMKNQSNIL